MSKRILHKCIVITLSLIMILCGMTYILPAWEVNAETSVTAAGAIVYCENTSEVVYQKNQNSQFCPYSLTKLMTVLLAAQNLSLDQEVTVSAAAADQSGSEVGLLEGETVTVKDLIYGALLPSGNDAAYALGEAVSGDVDTFVELMNTTASNIGCGNTEFADPTGLSSSNVTTPADYLKIARAAFSNRVIREAAGTTSYTMSKTNLSDERELSTKVDLLTDKDSGVVAGKTGYGSSDDCCIVVAYEKAGLDLIVILLEDTSAERLDDLRTLISSSSSSIEGVKAVSEGDSCGSVHVVHGEKTRVEGFVKTDGYAYLPSEGSESLVKTEIVYNDDVKAPLNAGDTVGHVKIYVGSEQVNSVPIIVKEDISEGWILSYVGISNFATIILLIIAAVIALTALVLFIVRERNRRRRQRARERRLRTIALQKLMDEEEHERRGWDL